MFQDVGQQLLLNVLGFHLGQSRAMFDSADNLGSQLHSVANDLLALIWFSQRSSSGWEEWHDHSRSDRYQECAGDRLAENAGNGQSGDSRPLNRGRAATNRVASRQNVSQFGNPEFA
jgi:hypothetical protein